jgi:hypothetical protein
MFSLQVPVRRETKYLTLLGVYIQEKFYKDHILGTYAYCSSLQVLVLGNITHLTASV